MPTCPSRSLVRRLSACALPLGAGIVLVTSVLVAGQMGHAAGPWYVSPSGDDGNDCLSPASACASINGALNKPGFVSGDTILVASGTYTGTGTYVVEVFFKSATISGGWNGGFTAQTGFSVLDGELARRGLYTAGPITVTLERLVIQHGTAGVFNSAALLIMNTSVITGNNATGFLAGGLENFGHAVLNATTIANNTTTDDGGGIDLVNGSVTLNNSTVSGNSGSLADAAYVYSGTLTLNNSTVSGTVSGKLTAANSFMSHCAGILNSSGYNLIEDATFCTVVGGAGDQLDVAGGLAPGLSGWPAYHALLPGSPAINAGNTAVPGSGGNACLAVDQRGVARPQAGRCDIGAFELEWELPLKQFLPLLFR